MQGKLGRPCSSLPHKSPGINGICQTHAQTCLTHSLMHMQMPIARSYGSHCWARMQMAQAGQSQTVHCMEEAGPWCRAVSTGLTGKSSGECCGATAVRALQASSVRLLGCVCDGMLQAPAAVRVMLLLARKDCRSSTVLTVCLACSHNQQLPCSSAAVRPAPKEADSASGTTHCAQPMEGFHAAK